MKAKRVEFLELPSWEEAQDKDFHFSYLYNVEFFFFHVDIYNFTKQFKIYCNHGIHTYDYRYEKTFDLRDKEQYNQACDICFRLFEGEVV